ncbi:hypothetical protein P5673_011303 [Acropora cervicornis]|uniref:Uncharacterized protein n=1 Tax=Acropora cervicornis TaxID=6130 RepID=A0AAD9QQ86_ACRCE|nr:hypothetical protein P5673_011303 [Acropora cervicornis]
MSTSDNDSDVSEDGISLKIDSKGPKDFNVCDRQINDDDDDDVSIAYSVAAE